MFAHQFHNPKVGFTGESSPMGGVTLQLSPGADPQQVIASLEEHYRMARDEIGWAIDEEQREGARSAAQFYKQAIEEAKRQAAASRGASRQTAPSPGMMQMPSMSLPPLPALPKTGLESILKDILK